MSEQMFSAPVTMPTHLPPRDAWRVDLDKLPKFYAPVDDRGFVMPEETIEAIKDLFDPDYIWPVDPRFQATKPDVHHFHWMARLYKPSRYQGRQVPIQFRELPTVKGIMPRQAHNVLHAVTLPPNLPKYSDMERHLQAYMLAQQLFRTARAAATTQHQFSRSKFVADESDAMANSMLIATFDRKFQGYRQVIEQITEGVAASEPQLDIKKLPKRSPGEVARILGKKVVQSQLNLLSLFPHSELEVAV